MTINEPRMTRVRMDEFPRLYSEPKPTAPTTGKVLPPSHDDDKAGLIAASAVLGSVLVVFIVTVIALLGGAL